MMMTKLKNIFCGLFFALAVCSHAVDVAPFDMTQENWDELMKFKMWAKGHITMAGSASVPDTVGAIGAGDSIILLNGNHTLGGPIYTGGIRADYGPDEFITGPVRARNYFLAGANGNKFHGTYCIGNEYSYNINENAINGISAAGGTLLTGSSATTGKCVTDKVPLVPNIWIPDIDKNASFNETIDGISISNSIYAIDVPNNVDVYDVHVEGNISFSNTAKLHIRMKTPQTLVRIFVEGSIEGSSATQIQVVYVNESAEYDEPNHVWTGVTESVLVSNVDYAGNVLFYSKGDISFPSMLSGAFIQGTFVSKGLISLGPNMVLAGQLLANGLYIGPDFNGTNLRYIPFDPPVLEATLAVEASALNGKFLENGADALIPIELNAKAKIDVLFKYCFDVKSNSSEGQASVEDFDASSLTFPVCDKNEYGQVVINMGSSEPTDASKIFINVKKDDVSEDDEILPLKIFDLSGAVLPENKHEGYFNLTIGDNAGVTPKFAGSEKYYSISENSLTGFMVARIPVENVSVVDELIVTLEDNAASGQTRASDILNLSLDSDDGSVYAVLSVKDGSKLDYETIQSPYKVTLTLKDQNGAAGCNQDTIIRTINIVDVNENPVITGVKDLNPDFAGSPTPFMLYPKENLAKGYAIGVVMASDPDIKNIAAFGHLEYSIIDPNGDIPFEMRYDTVVVSDPSKLNYEAAVNEFAFDVMVSNCAKNSTTGKYTENCLDVVQTVTVKLQDVPEEPTIECEQDDVDCYGPFEVKENSPTGYVVMSYLVSDEDYGFVHTGNLTATIKNTNGSGADSLFIAEMKKDTNGNWRVVVSVVDGSKLDYEKVKETHNVTICVYDPEDPAGMYDSLLRVIKVVDVNEAPKANDVNLKASENLPKGTVVGKIDVVDPDVKHVKEFGHLEYSIIGKDETFAFVMDSSKVVVNDPSKMDYELNVLSYIFDVQIANCELNYSTGKYNSVCLYDTARVTVKLQDGGEPPIIVVDGPTPDGEDDSDSLCIAFCDTTSRGVTKNDTLTVGVRENTAESLLSPTGKILFQYHVVDEDTGHVAGAKVTWFDVGTSIPNVKMNGSDLFAISYKNGVISVSVKDEMLLDYETLRNANSRNDPDPEYTMGVVVTDPLGLADTLYRKIRVIDVNEKPIFSVWPISIIENNFIGDSLGCLEHPSDIDSLSRNPAFYDNSSKMIGGNIELVSLVQDSTNLMRSKLVANAKLDCENGEYVCGQDSIYWVELAYGDTTLKDLYTELKVPVKLIDVNESPKINTDTIGVDENAKKGTLVGIIEWEDVDQFDSVMLFEITKDPSGCFTIDKNTGAVTVKSDKCTALDFEKHVSLNIEVSITDMVNVKDRSLIFRDSITVKKIIKVNVHDVNESPTEISIDCVDSKENTNILCKYFRVGDSRGLSLYDVPPEKPFIKANAIPGASFYVYAPKTPSDSVKFSLWSDSTEISHGMNVVSDDSGIVKLRVNSVYPIYNVAVGTANNADMSDAIVSLVYNFYAPEIEFCLDKGCKNPVTAETKLKKNVGDTLAVYARAFIPVGPKKGQTDSLLMKTFYIKNADENLRFYDLNGVDLSNSRIDFVDGQAAFIVVANKAISEGLSFSLNSFRDPLDETKYIVSQKFPGNVLFVNSAMSPLDSASTTNPDTPSENEKDDPQISITISTTVQESDSSNTYRITEKVADDDANIYVNKASDTVYVKLKDANSKTDTVFALSYNLETISVSETIFTKITSVAKQEVKLNENPENGVAQILLNGSIIKASYTESVVNVNVTVSYKIDSKGAVVKQAVVNEKNKIDSVETIVVSYKTKIDDKNVEISYLADALTGEMLVKDSLGNLLTKLAAHNRPGINLGCYYISYDDGESPKSMVVTYMVNSKGDVVKNEDGNVSYDVSYTFEDKYGRSTTQVVNVVLDLTAPKVEIRSPENNQQIRSNFVDVEWYVDGVLQDSLNVQPLKYGSNEIVREFCDKAGNCGADTVVVMCNDDACDEEIFAEPTFRVVMTGPFQFTIVLDWASNSALKKNYAVMDLQGRILQQGVIGSAETVVPVLTSGSYIVKVGRGKRVVNVR